MNNLKGQIIDSIIKLLTPLKNDYPVEINTITNELINGQTDSLNKFIEEHQQALSYRKEIKDFINNLVDNNLLDDSFKNIIKENDYQFIVLKVLNVLSTDYRPLNVKVDVLERIKQHVPSPQIETIEKKYYDEINLEDLSLPQNETNTPTTPVIDEFPTDFSKLGENNVSAQKSTTDEPNIILDEQAINSNEQNTDSNSNINETELNNYANNLEQYQVPITKLDSINKTMDEQTDIAKEPNNINTIDDVSQTTDLIEDDYIQVEEPINTIQESTTNINQETEFNSFEPTYVEDNNVYNEPFYEQPIPTQEPINAVSESTIDMNQEPSLSSFEPTYVEDNDVYNEPVYDQPIQVEEPINTIQDSTTNINQETEFNSFEPTYVEDNNVYNKPIYEQPISTEEPVNIVPDTTTNMEQAMELDTFKPNFIENDTSIQTIRKTTPSGVPNYILNNFTTLKAEEPPIEEEPKETIIEEDKQVDIEYLRKKILDAQLNYINNAPQFIMNLEEQEPNSIYKSLIDLNDIRYIQHSLSKLSSDTLDKLLPYVEDKLEENRHSSIDMFIIDVIKKYLHSKNKMR